MDLSLPYPDVESKAGLADFPHHDLMQGEGSGSVFLLPWCRGGKIPSAEERHINTAFVCGGTKWHPGDLLQVIRTTVSP